MRRRWIALALALLALALLAGMAQAQTETDGQTTQEESAAQALDVEALLSACQDRQLSTRTQLVDVLHEYVLGQMNISIKELAVENASNALEDLEAQYLMGTVESADLEAAEKAVSAAQAEADKAQLEQMKLVSRVRGFTGQDITGCSADAQDFFLTLQPSQLSLDLLKSALTSSGEAENLQEALIDLEQSYIDVSLYYEAISSAQETYAAAEEARQGVARDVMMGNASSEDFRSATVEMRQARLELMTAISDYSRLLYSINESCGGALCDQAGMLEEYLGAGA